MRKNSSLVLVAAVVLALAVFAWWQGWLPLGGGDPAPLNAAQTGDVILVFGGAAAPPAADSDLTAALREIMGVSVSSAAPPIVTSAQVSAMTATMVGGHKPNFVILAVGANDLTANTPLEDTMRHLETAITVFQQGGALVVVLGVDAPGVGDNWNMAVRDLCRSRRVLWIDDPLKGRYGDPGIASDLLPTPGGLKLIAGKIADRLKKFRN